MFIPSDVSGLQRTDRQRAGAARETRRSVSYGPRPPRRFRLLLQLMKMMVMNVFGAL